MSSRVRIRVSYLMIVLWDHGVIDHRIATPNCKASTMSKLKFGFCKCMRKFVFSVNMFISYMIG